jgi:cbb3-type cytochrome oxidase subunit 3
MKNYIKFKAIVSIIVSINFLLATELAAKGTNFEQNGNLQEINQQSNKNNPDPKLINSFNELKNSIKSFNSELPSAVNNPNQQNEINSQDIILKLDNLKKELSTLQQTDTVKKIIAITEEINITIAPLKNGLQSNSVTQVQKKLDFFTREGISKKSYGKFGETTQKEIDKFLNQNLDDLEKQVNQIKSVPKTIEKSQNNLQSAKNNDNTQALKAQISELKNDINKISALVYILLFIILVAIGFYAYKFYIFANSSSRNRSNKNLNLNNDNQNKIINFDTFKIEVMNEIYEDLNKVLHDFSTRIQKLENSYENQINSTSQSKFTSTNINQPVIQTTKISYPQNPVNTTLYSQSSIFNSDSKLLSLYNFNSRSLSQNAITISESEYTTEQRRLGRNVSPVLEASNRGNYWILKEGSNEYLFPKGGMKINEHNYHTIAAFFECVGYQTNGNNNFTVVKAAKVSSIGEQWELRETGQINFHQ